ncbi:MAG TPA: response regulator [Sedimentisphaerales bacterium]|nr:response regulator [Sedimentisphaerales bacterium]
MRSYQPILLVEDDDADAIITRRVLSDLKVTNKIVHKTDGDEALAYLQDSANPRPCAILLDINMPRMNGLDLLAAVKAEESLRKMPVIMLTTSDADKDISRSYELGAAGYITKPCDYKEFVEAMKTMNLYWSLCRMPNTDCVAASLRD